MFVSWWLVLAMQLLRLVHGCIAAALLLPLRCCCHCAEEAVVTLLLTMLWPCYLAMFVQHLLPAAGQTVLPGWWPGCRGLLCWWTHP
jgi:hypothetical protein